MGGCQLAVIRFGEKIMILAMTLLAGIALDAPAAAQVLPASPPPIVAIAEPAAPAQRGLLIWKAGPITSAGLSDPMPTQLTFVPAAGAQNDVTLTFDIDAEGRPFGISGTIDARMRFASTDLMPSLRASRLAVSGVHRGCSITYSPVIAPLAEVPLATLARFGVTQRAQIDKASWDRFATGDCRNSTAPAPLLRSYPDWRKFARRMGEWGWTYVRYDIDAAGVPVNIATVIGSGDPAIDAAGVEAIAASRYASGPRTGCVHAWWLGPETVPAPPPPAADGNPACEIPDRWDRAPRLVFPPPYKNRAVEGWAVLRFDVAPWGEIGAVTVLDAGPTSEFGPAAMAVLRTARFKASDTGLKGCVDRVLFRINAGSGNPLEIGTAVAVP
jgi:TonB family protein